MKKALLLFFLAGIINNYVNAQLLYSASNAVNSFAPGAGANGTPVAAFDDVNIPGDLIAGSDSISITKLVVGIGRDANAPATVARIYYTVPDDTSAYDNFIKIPPVLVGTINLPANGSTPTAVAVSLGDSISSLFKVKTNVGNVYTGYHTFFIGVSFDNPDEGNLIVLGTGDANDDVMWIYDVDDANVRYAARFPDGGPSATFYMRVYGKTSTALPVTISSFGGERYGAENVLSWTTATEQNNKGFEVQSSIDGTNFSAVAFVDSKASNGFSTSALSYRFADRKPLGEDMYYRLKQVDKDGKATISSAVLLKGLAATKFVLAGVYPNPAANNLHIILSAPANDKVTFIISDLSGKVALQQTMPVIAGSNNLPINISNLSSGNYLIKVVCGNGCETSAKKFIKQ